MQRLVRPLLLLRIVRVLVVLEAVRHPVAVRLVHERVVQREPGLLDVGDLVTPAVPCTRHLVDLVRLGEHRNVREHLLHHVGRRRVHGLLMVLGVPRQDDRGEPREPRLLPQHLYVLGQGLAVPLAAIVEKETTVEVLKREPACCVALLSRRADVEHDVHGMAGVEIEVHHPTVLQHLVVRLAVHGSSIHLLEVNVVLLIEHAVVAVPLQVRVLDLFKPLLAQHRRQALSAHHLVQVVDRTHNNLRVLAPLNGLHQLPQRIIATTSRGRHSHQAPAVVLVLDDRHESRDRIFAEEQRQLGDRVVLV